MKKQFTLFVLALIPWLSTFGSPLDNGIDVIHYAFTIKLSDSTDLIHARADIDIRFKSEANDFFLDFDKKDESGMGMMISAVMLNQESLSFTHEAQRVKISLPKKSQIGELITVSILYEGVPRDGLFISKNRYNQRTFFGDNWPNRAHHWLPTNDHPSDKASVEFNITAPPIYSVVANGAKVEESYLNPYQKLTRWHEEIEISTKVMVIGVARFALVRAGQVGAIPVETWAYPEDKVKVANILDMSTDVLEYFQQHIGPYSYEKLSSVQSKTIYGGMENASNIFYPENAFDGDDAINTIVPHEIAHQWFGNSATETDWRHIWLSEGFATYFSFLYIQHSRGLDAFNKELIDDRVKIIDYHKKNSLPIVYGELPKDLIDILNINSYEKGSWVLHMLRRTLGDNVFWAGIRKYYRTYQNRNAETADFRRVMEEVSGKNLETFFRQWLYEPNHPILKTAWTYDAKAKMMTLTVNQTQAGHPLQFPLEVAIEVTGEGQPVFETLFIDKTVNKFSVPVKQKPLKITLDPHVNLLFEAETKN